MDGSDAFPPDAEPAHLDAVRRRVAEVDSGKVAMIPGNEVFAEGRRIIDAARKLQKAKE
jgi:hypothetical protein